MPTSDQVAAELPSLVELYRHLHAHPELSHQEVESAGRLARELEAAGFAVEREIGGHGVVGVLANGPGPVVLLRTDLDALPVTEATGLPWASRVRTTGDDGSEVGVMHACGHDLHMTCLTGTARILAATRGEWAGTVVAIGQPAEEKGMGAVAMLADGLYERFPRPDFALALHASPSLPAGSVGIRPGPALANVDFVDVVVHGRGGHGAYPHTTRDPVVLAAEIVLALQTVVSREISPIEPAVVTVGFVHGGTKHNVIADSVRLGLTLRSYSDAVREQTLAAIRRILAGLAAAAGAPKPPELTVLPGTTPATVNDPALVERTAAAFRSELGDDRVVVVEPVLGGEDFGQLGRTAPPVPIHIFWLGTLGPGVAEEYRRRGEPLPSLHSASFAPDVEPALRTGVRALVAGARELLR